MREDSTAALACLERRFLVADRLALILATVAGRDRLGGAAWDSMETTDRMVASYAVGSALRLASTWVNLHTGELATQLGRYAVADAVAGEDLREVMPEVAASLRAAWTLALEVRAQVRQLARSRRSGPADRSVLACGPARPGDRRRRGDSKRTPSRAHNEL